MTAKHQAYANVFKELERSAYINVALKEVLDELNRASEKYGAFNSTHEGYAIILEELDELWDEVKTNGSNERLRQEATQVAAMAIRFMIDIAR